MCVMSISAALLAWPVAMSTGTVPLTITWSTQSLPSAAVMAMESARSSSARSGSRRPTRAASGAALNAM